MSIIPSKERDRWRRILAPVIFAGLVAFYLAAPTPTVPAGESLRQVAAARGWEAWRAGDSPLWAAIAHSAAARSPTRTAETLAFLSAIAVAGAATLLFLVLGNYIHNRTPEELFHEPFPALLGLAPAVVVTLLFATSAPARGQAAPTADGLRLLSFAAFAWSISASARSGRRSYLFLAGLIFALGAPGSRVLLFSAPLALLYLAFGSTTPWWRRRRLAALGTGLGVGLALHVALTFHPAGPGRLVVTNMREWLLAGSEPETVVVRVEMTDPLNPRRTRTRVTMVPAMVVEGTHSAGRLGGATLFLVGLVPLGLVGWNYRGDMRRDKTPRDTQIGAWTRRVTFLVLAAGGVWMFAVADRLAELRIGMETAALAQVYFLVAMWLAYCIGYWMIVLGSPPARYRRKSIAPWRLATGRVAVAALLAGMLWQTAAAAEDHLAYGSVDGLDGHLARVVASIRTGAEDAPPAVPVILTADPGEEYALRLYMATLGGEAAARPVAVEQLLSQSDRPDLADRSGLPVAPGPAADKAAAVARARAEISAWSRLAPVFSTERINFVLPTDAVETVCGVLYRVAPVDAAGEAPRSVQAVSVRLWDRWIETGDIDQLAPRFRESYARLLNDLAVDVHQLAIDGDTIAWLETATRLDSMNPCAWFNLAVLLRSHGEPDRAAEAMRNYKLVAGDLGDDSDWVQRLERFGDILAPDAYAAIGATRIDAGDEDGAARAFATALRREPGHRASLAGVATVRLSRGDVDGADRDVDRILASHPDDADGLVLRARVMVARGDRAGAVALLDTVLAGTRTHEEALFTIGTTLMEMGDALHAIHYLDRLVTLNGTDPDYLVAFGEAQYAHDQFNGCVATAERLLARDAAEPRALRLRGLARIGLGDLEGAVADLEPLEGRFAADADRLWALGEAARRLGDDPEMRRWWDEFLRLHPDDPRANAARGHLDAPET